MITMNVGILKADLVAWYHLVTADLMTIICLLACFNCPQVCLLTALDHLLFGVSPLRFREFRTDYTFVVLSFVYLKTSPLPLFIKTILFFSFTLFRFLFMLLFLS